MRSAFHTLPLGLAVLISLFLAMPGHAQELPVVGDPFSDVSAADNAHMSTVSGVPGASVLPGGSSQGCGTGCAGAAPAAIGTAPVGQRVTTGNSVTVNVTAINNQTAIVGPGAINTGGGLNSAGGGN